MELSELEELYNIKTIFLVYSYDAFYVIVKNMFKFRDVADTEKCYPEILTPKHDC